MGEGPLEREDVENKASSGKLGCGAMPKKPLLWLEAGVALCEDGAGVQLPLLPVEDCRPMDFWGCEACWRSEMM